MAVVQVLLGLCLVSVAVAAPQLGSRRTVTTSTKEVSSNPDQIVSSVISSLQQPIALAVAEALRSLQTTQTITTTGSSGGFGSAKSGFSSSGISSAKKGFSSASLSSANTGLSGFGATAKSGYTTSKSGSISSNGGYSGATGGLGLARGSSFTSSGGSVASQSSAPVDLGPYIKPEYKYEYKVSDDAAQTYISMEEARDGTELTGTYSYIDANGALVTVNYIAGVNGYEETRDVQDGAVQIRAQPVTTYEASYESSSSAAADLAASQYAAAQQAAAERLVAQQAAAQRAAEQKSAAAFRVQQAAIKRTAEKRIAAEKAASLRASAAEAASLRASAAKAASLRASAEKAAAQRVTVSKSSTFNSDALIAQILASLQPQIGAVVQNAISATRVSTPVVRTSSVQVAAPLVRTSSLQAVSSPVLRTSSQTVSSQNSGLTSLFGVGGNVVRIATPKFQVEY